jgi:predicted ATPase
MVAGLPGCGKTTYLDELRRAGWSVFDDFKAEAIGDSSRFD